MFYTASDGAAVRIGLRQSMPSSNIESCARLKQTTLLVRLRPDETPPFQTLSQQAQPVTIPPKHFDEIAASAPEDENVTRIRVLFEHGLRGRAETSEAAPHIGDAGSDPDARV